MGSRYLRDEFVEDQRNAHVVLKANLIFELHMPTGEVQELTSIVTSFEKDNKRKELKYQIFNNGILKLETFSTTEFSRFIFKKLHIPRIIVWTKAKVSMAMDDLLRMWLLQQETINHVHKYEDILPAISARKIRIAIIMLWMLNPFDDLLKKMIDNESLFRKATLENAVLELENVAKNKSALSANLSNIVLHEDIPKQLFGLEEEKNNYRKELIELNKELAYLNYKQKNAKVSSQMSIISNYLNEYKKRDHGMHDEVKKWIETNESAIKLLEFSNVSLEIEAKTEQITLLKEKISYFDTKIKAILNSVDDTNSPAIIMGVSKILKSKLVSDGSNMKVKEIEKEYEDRYRKILLDFSKFVNLNNNETLIWSKKGGALTLVSNVKRFVSVSEILKKNNVLMPLLIDGIVAEDFSGENENVSWVKDAFETDVQKIITISTIDNASEQIIKTNIKRYVLENEKNVQTYTLTKQIIK